MCVIYAAPICGLLVALFTSCYLDNILSGESKLSLYVLFSIVADNVLLGTNAQLLKGFHFYFVVRDYITTEFQNHIVLTSWFH